MGTEHAARNASLISWYRRYRRRLPWRGSTDPYRILVSEVMLQQTQATRVVDRFERFLDRFPTIDDLAAASLTDVIDEWSGLGYNSRARRLRDAARIVQAEGWPETASALERLPGVGPYTAAAVACFGFGEEVPAVDTNLRRVLSRWTGVPLAGAALQRAARDHLGAPAVDWNQAVMDLGAMVCTPRAPDCASCPVEVWCHGPDVYAAPRRQARFEGSDRQVRGAVVRELASGRPMTAVQIAANTGFDSGRIEVASEALRNEGMVVADGDELRLAD